MMEASKKCSFLLIHSQNPQKNQNIAWTLSPVYALLIICALLFVKVSSRKLFYVFICLFFWIYGLVSAACFSKHPQNVDVKNCTNFTVVLSRLVIFLIICTGIIGLKDSTLTEILILGAVGLLLSFKTWQDLHK